MSKDLHQRDAAQARGSKLLLAMGIIVLLGALAYFILTLVVNRRTPANPDTTYTAENGVTVSYESGIWPPLPTALTPIIRWCCSSGATKTPTLILFSSQKAT